LKVIWAILCQSSVTDSGTNNISLFNVVEEIQLPAQPPQSLGEAVSRNISPAVLELVVLWIRSEMEGPERGLGRVRLIQPGGAETTLGQDFEVDLNKFLRLRSRLRLAGLPTSGEGNYLFKLDGKPAGGEWTQMFEFPLRVILQAEDTG